MTTPVVVSERLILRPFREGEALAAFQLWFSQPDVAKYMFWKTHSDIKETEDWLLDEISSIDDDDWYRFAVERIEDQQLLGTVLLYYEEELEGWEIVYCFAREFWNQGYATESIQTIISFAKEQLELEKIFARVALVNMASRKALEKLGFCHSGRIVYTCNGGNSVLPGLLYCLFLLPE